MAWAAVLARHAPSRGFDGPTADDRLVLLWRAVALGLIAEATWPPDGAPVGRRVPTGRLAFVLMAFCVGVATLGTVVGLLAVFQAGAVTDTASGLLAAGPAVGGGMIGLVLVAPHWRAGDPRTSAFAGVNDEQTARAIYSAEISRCALIQIAYCGAGAAAIVLIVFG